MRYCQAGVLLAHIQHTGWRNQHVPRAHGAVRHPRGAPRDVGIVEADIADSAVVESIFVAGTNQGAVDAAS